MVGERADCLLYITRSSAGVRQPSSNSLRASHPANRIGSAQLEFGQLKILQEVITLAVFVPFAALYMKEPVRLNYLWAAVCMAGAVYFIFRR